MFANSGQIGLFNGLVLFLGIPICMFLLQILCLPPAWLISNNQILFSKLVKKPNLTRQDRKHCGPDRGPGIVYTEFDLEHTGMIETWSLLIIVIGQLGTIK
jgi:hypothetical protein